MRAIVFGDLHIDTVAPDFRRDTYLKDITMKLVDVLTYYREHKSVIDCIITTGDFFKRKTISYTALNQIISLLSGFDCPIYTCIGHHDVQFGKVGFLDKTPLGTLRQVEILHVLNKDDVVVVGDCVLQGCDDLYYLDTGDRSGYEFNLDSRYKDKIKIKVTHGSVFPDGTTFFGDYSNVGDLQDFNFDWLINGHLHGNPSYEEKYGKMFVWAGSVARTAIDDNRNELFYLDIDFTNKKIEGIPFVNVVEFDSIKNPLRVYATSKSEFIERIINTNVTNPVELEDVIRAELGDLYTIYLDYKDKV